MENQIDSEYGNSERKKVTQWTEEEHRRFLEGLKKYDISKNSVITPTPTQVASYALKYFRRLHESSLRKGMKRESIHNISTTNNTTVVQTPTPTNISSGEGTGGEGGGAPPQNGV